MASYTKIKCFLGLPFIGVLLFTNSALGQNLSLSKAKEHLLSNNGNYTAASFNVKRFEEEQKATKGLHLPKIEIRGNYLHLQDNIEVNLNPQRNTLAGFLNISDPTSLGNWQKELQGRDFAFASTRATLPIYTGGKINAANKASKVKVGIANNEKELKEEELSIKLITAYYRVKLSHELLKLRNEVFKSVSLHKERADKFHDNGLIAEVESLNAKVAYANAKREVINAEKDKELAETALQNLIGNINLGDLTSEFHIPEQYTSLSEFQDKMIAESQHLELLNKNEELAGIAIKKEKSDYLPSLAAVGNYRFFNESFSIGQTEWFAGLQLQWTLFNGFQREHKIKAAEHTKSQVQSLKKQVEFDLLTLTEKLYNSMQKQQEMQISLIEDLKLAEELKYMRERAFEEGLGTSLEVIDATVNLSKVKFQELLNLYEYTITKGELMVHIGNTENFFN